MIKITFVRRKTMPRIPEGTIPPEIIQNLRDRLELIKKIRLMSNHELSKISGVAWYTFHKFVRGEPVAHRSLRRIKAFIEKEESRNMKKEKLYKKPE